MVNIKLIKEIGSPYKEMALSNQIKQGNKPNKDLRLGESVSDGGFKWGETDEGYDFWFEIFNGESPEITDEIKSYHPDVFDLVE